MMISSKRVNPTAATALCCTMPLSNRDRLTRELWLLRCELAEIRAQAAAQRRWAALGRAEARSVCEESERLQAETRRLLQACRPPGAP